MTNQITNHLKVNQLEKKFQSGFKRNHSVESALLGVFNDIYINFDQRKNVDLCLIDLSAAFDTIGHTKLMELFKQNFRIEDLPLKLITTFMVSRVQSVRIGTHHSEPKSLLHGVTQGTLIGPLILSMHVSPLNRIFEEKVIPYHAYPDDTQFLINYNNITDL